MRSYCICDLYLSVAWCIVELVGSFTCLFCVLTVFSLYLFCCVCVCCVCVCVVCVFFQAEDGIRDLVRSRGLGDVYKRQAMGKPPVWCSGLTMEWGWMAGQGGGPAVGAARRRREIRQNAPTTVSFTHLTLPTSDLVEISVVAGTLKKKKKQI